jgi:hypothetical protein
MNGMNRQDVARVGCILRAEVRRISSLIALMKLVRSTQATTLLLRMPPSDILLARARVELTTIFDRIEEVMADRHMIFVCNYNQVPDGFETTVVFDPSNFATHRS